MALTVISNKEGRVTIPAEVRAALRIEGETHWTVEIADGAVVMRPAVVVPREDAWAYTPEHVTKVQRAREDVRAGREVAVGADELRRIAALPDDDMSDEIDRLRAAAQGDRRA